MFQCWFEAGLAIVGEPWRGERCARFPKAKPFLNVGLLRERPVGDEADFLIVVVPGALGEDPLEGVAGRIVSKIDRRRIRSSCCGYPLTLRAQSIGLPTCSGPRSARAANELPRATYSGVPVGVRRVWNTTPAAARIASAKKTFTPPRHPVILWTINAAPW